MPRQRLCQRRLRFCQSTLAVELGKARAIGWRGPPRKGWWHPRGCLGRSGACDWPGESGWCCSGAAAARRSCVPLPKREKEPKVWDDWAHPSVSERRPGSVGSDDAVRLDPVRRQTLMNHIRDTAS